MIPRSLAVNMGRAAGSPMFPAEAKAQVPLRGVWSQAEPKELTGLQSVEHVANSSYRETFPA